MNEQMTIFDFIDRPVDFSECMNPPEEAKPMQILVACEESQAVCIAMRERGHEAYSCDICTESGGHSEWHIKADVLPLLDGHCTFKTEDGVSHTIDGKWDMIIAFPPCTHLATSGARHFERKRADGSQLAGLWFFAQIFGADCDKIAVENPVNIMSGGYVEEHFPYHAKKYGFPRKPTQIIQPWQFGDGEQKTTCLWLKGLDKLVPTVTEKPDLEFFEFTTKNGERKRMARWYYDAAFKPYKDRGKLRSKTFKGVAEAMAATWG